MNILKYVAYALVIIGALNWGMVGLFSFDLVAAVFGDMTLLTRTIYTIVGVSAVVTALTMHHCEVIRKEETCEYGNCNL